ncbi:unnamed protein product [Orchesella dallaii]|uniref:Fibritin C-terminal domain-containing protein n=1 Tax=Orchesella dallaii TaxID=48710 RepID=A0ABP1RZT2_9HEXA
MLSYWIVLVFGVCSSIQLATGQFCEQACLDEIEGAKDYAANLHANTNANIDNILGRLASVESKQRTYDDVLTRVVMIENDLQSNISRIEKRINDEVNYVLGEISIVRGRVEVLEANEFADDMALSDLSTRVKNAETNLKGNATQLSNQIFSEVASLNTILSDYITNVNRDLTARIDKVVASIPPSTPGGTTPIGTGSAMDVYYNLTRRIDNLEFGKISNLSADNNIWRQNFRVVNTTFEKLKKGNYLMTGGR